MSALREVSNLTNAPGGDAKMRQANRLAAAAAVAAASQPSGSSRNHTYYNAAVPSSTQPHQAPATTSSTGDAAYGISARVSAHAPASSTSSANVFSSSTVSSSSSSFSGSQQQQQQPPSQQCTAAMPLPVPYPLSSIPINTVVESSASAAVSSAVSAAYTRRESGAHSGAAVAASAAATTTTAAAVTAGVSGAPRHSTSMPTTSAAVAHRRSPALNQPPPTSAHSLRYVDPTQCNELIVDITNTFIDRERQAVRRFNEGITSYNRNTAVLHSYYASPHYLQYQPEINEKMRVILIDWLIDVHIKYKLHCETLFLTVNIIDRYLSCINIKFNSTTFVARSKLQLVGVCAMLLAAKYEEIWPPGVKECVHITANTYTREEVLQMERAICTALNFRLTVPTAYQFAVRLVNVLERDDIFPGTITDISSNKDYDTHGQQQQQDKIALRFCAQFFMEHAILDYKCLQFTPSQVGNSSVFLALTTMRVRHDVPLTSPIWNETLRHHSRADVGEFRACVMAIMEFVNYVPTTKYQAIRRKFNSSHYGEVSKWAMPKEIPRW